MSRTKKKVPGAPLRDQRKKEAKGATELAERDESVQTEDGDIAMEDEDLEVEEERDRKGKKEKREKKDRKGRKSGKENLKEENKGKTAVDKISKPDPTSESSKKRKRDPAISEIEIDINLPEPPSKKALRKLKKNPALADIPAKPPPKPKTDKPIEDYPEHSSQARSKWGIWIGNLPFSTTRPQLEEFLTHAPSTIQRIEVTRINLPVDPRTKRNKGFAYIDFANEKALDYALTLTETLFHGRKVLIKNSKDFSNRNNSTSTDGPKLGANLSKNPPSKILFVGNLDFDTKDGDLKRHFEFAGKIVKVRLATFEDTGKCKGFGFIDFEDIDSVKRAMLGLSAEEEESRNQLEGKDEEELSKQQKKRKFIGPRQIKMEYGEDPSVRYKKRFGKDRPDREEDEGGVEPEESSQRKRRPKQDEDWAEKAWEMKREKMDRRSNNPGAAYSNDARRTGAITESKGRKMKFDDA